MYDMQREKKNAYSEGARPSFDEHVPDAFEAMDEYAEYALDDQARVDASVDEPVTVYTTGDVPSTSPFAALAALAA